MFKRGGVIITHTKSILKQSTRGFQAVQLGYRMRSEEIFMVHQNRKASAATEMTTRQESASNARQG